MALMLAARNLKSVGQLSSKSYLLRTMSSFLIEQPKYSFLKDLGLEKSNVGVYNGQWFANGEVLKLFCSTL